MAWSPTIQLTFRITKSILEFHTSCKLHLLLAVLMENDDMIEKSQKLICNSIFAIALLQHYSRIEAFQITSKTFREYFKSFTRTQVLVQIEREGLNIL